MQGFAQIRCTQSAEQAFEFREKTKPMLKEYFKNTLRLRRNWSSNASCLTFAEDESSFVALGECFLKIPTNGPSTTLGRGGPTSAVRSYLRHSTHVPRASCMISLESWTETILPLQWQDAQKPSIKMMHRFKLACLRGRIRVIRFCSSTGYQRHDQKFTNKKLKMDSTVEFTMGSINSKDFALCADSKQFSVSQMADMKTFSGKTANTKFPMNNCSPENKKALHESRALADCTPSEFLYPNQETYLTDMDAFEINDSGVYVTCLTFRSESDPYKLLIANRASIAKFVQPDDRTADNAELLSSIKACISSIDPLASQTSGPVMHSHDNVVLSKEAHSHDSSAQSALSSDSLSNTQFMDILGNLEAFVDQVERPTPRTPSQIECGTKSGDRHDNESPKNYFVDRNSRALFWELDSNADFIGDSPKESQVVFFKHRQD